MQRFRIVHLMASPFFGGPERQVLGLARHLSSRYESTFISFDEDGRCQDFLKHARRHGFQDIVLKHNTPRFRQSATEVARLLRKLRADVLCCSGYKPDIVGWWAARQAGVPALSISHGWTAATWKVRVNETCDRWVIRFMDAVVCVSQAQADKVRRAGVSASRIAVIQNAVPDEAFAAADPVKAAQLRSFFPNPPRWIVGAAGRLSPEKGFAYLIDAAAQVLPRHPEVGFIVFGAGPLREQLTAQLAALGLQGRFVLAGFRDDVAGFLPHLDAVVLPSLTEGLPVILLEACAAGVPVVATNVGGIPEVVADGINGRLVAAGAAKPLADGIASLFDGSVDRRALGMAGQARVRNEFTFATQRVKYEELFERVTRLSTRRKPALATN